MMFGEYLVARNYVSSEDLFAALLEQMNALPPEIMILYQQQKITAAEGLKILVTQSEGNIEFRGAMTLLGLWRAEMDDIVLSELAKHRIPIGQILIRRGALSSEILGAALDDYFREKKRLKIQAAKVLAGQQKNDSFEGLFSEDIYFEMTAELLMLDSTKEKAERNKILVQLQGHLNMMVQWPGLREHFFTKEISEKILIFIVFLLSDEIAAQEFLAVHSETVVSRILEAVKFLWRLRQAVCSQGNETSVSGRPELMQEFQKLIKDLQVPLGIVPGTTERS